MHFNDPTDTTLPPSEQTRQRREKQARRRALALAYARSAGEFDARGLGVEAAGEWRHVESLVGSPVPRVFVRARAAAAKASRLPVS